MSDMSCSTSGQSHEEALDDEARYKEEALMEKKKLEARLIMQGWSAEEIVWLQKEDLEQWQLDHVVKKAYAMKHGSSYPNHEIVERQHIAQMGLEQIWRQPTPANDPLANLVYRDWLIPTPLPTFYQHYQLLESAPSSAHPAHPAHRRVHTPPGFPAGMSQRPAHARTQTKAPHPLAQSYRPSHVFNYSAEYADHELPPAYAYQSLRVNTHALDSYVEPQPIPLPNPPTLESGLAIWYAEQVVSALVIPGAFRRGAGGTDDKVWGFAGVFDASYARGHPSYSSGKFNIALPHFPRDVKSEEYDPWGIAEKQHGGVSPRFVAHVFMLIERMRIEPSTIIAAVWYLHGLGLHVGDEGKGRRLRELLEDSELSDREAVENRVAMLGLLMAGKWLDDSSYESKQWAEISSIPISEVVALEFAALKDIWCSLYISPSAWMEFLHKQFAELDGRNYAKQPAGMLVLHHLMDLIEQAQPKPKTTRIPPWQMDTWYFDDIDARLEAAFYASDEEEDANEPYPEWADEENATGNAGVSYPPSGFHAHTDPLSGWSTPQSDEQIVDAARFVDALVDDVPSSNQGTQAVGRTQAVGEGLEVSEAEDEEAEPILEYDGARPFPQPRIPTAAEKRRRESAAVHHWRNTVQSTANNRAVNTPSSPNPRYGHSIGEM